MNPLWSKGREPAEPEPPPPRKHGAWDAPPETSPRPEPFPKFTRPRDEAPERGVAARPPAADATMEQTAAPLPAASTPPRGTAAPSPAAATPPGATAEPSPATAAPAAPHPRGGARSWFPRSP